MKRFITVALDLNDTEDHQLSQRISYLLNILSGVEDTDGISISPLRAVLSGEPVTQDTFLKALRVLHSGREYLSRYDHLTPQTSIEEAIVSLHHRQRERLIEVYNQLSRIYREVWGGDRT